MKKRLLIVGTGGQAKVVLDCALAKGSYEKIAFLKETAEQADIFSYSSLLEAEWPLERCREAFDEAIVAIGNNQVRLQKTRELEKKGMRTATLEHPRAIVSPLARVDAGSVILAGAVVNAFAEIGRGCIINSGAIVEHDCMLADGVHISPGAAIGGGVSIGEAVWICMGAIVVDHLAVGRYAVVGAGATVLCDVPAAVLVAGTPAEIKKKYAQAWKTNDNPLDEG